MIDKNMFVPITDLAKHVSSYVNKAKNDGALYIMKNNKPEVVMMDIEEYNRLLILREYIEQNEIYKVVQERKDSKATKTLDDVMKDLGISDKDLE